MSTSSSGVRRGGGTTVRVGRGINPDWTLLVGTEDSPFPDQSPDDIDSTWQQSPNDTEESIRGMFKVGLVTIPLHFVPGSPTDILLWELLETGELIVLEITPNGGESHQWGAYVKDYRPTALSARDKMMAQVVFTAQGRMPRVPASAPVNTTLPAISGLAQVGQVLTAWPGNWQPHGAPSYQWQEDDGGWTNIAGATAQTYTPVVGQLGNPLRVVVTQTNSLGATVANAVQTAAVIAA